MKPEKNTPKSADEFFVLDATGAEIRPRSLSNGTIRHLRANGMDPMMAGKEGIGAVKAVEMFDYIQDHDFAGIDFSKAANNDVTKLLRDSYNASFGRVAEAKNS